MMSPVSSSVMANRTGPPAGVAIVTPLLLATDPYLMMIHGWVRTALSLGVKRSTADAAPAANRTAGSWALCDPLVSTVTPAWPEGSGTKL